MKKENYEKPTIEIVEFTIEESITTSGTVMSFGPGALCTLMESEAE